MISSNSRRYGFTVLAGVFLLLSGTSPVSFAQDVLDQPADATRGGQTAVGADAESGPHIWKVIAEAVDEGVRALEPVRFWISGGNTVFITWVPRGNRPKTIDAGIIVDDGVPF